MSNRAFFEARALPSRSRDLTLYGKNIRGPAPEAVVAASGHSRTQVGAPVASQRCRTLRLGVNSIAAMPATEQKIVAEDTETGV